MADRLAGKVAIVTGGNSGIGEATVKLFAREGAKVAIMARREAEGAAVESAVREAGGEATFIPCDVTDRESIESAVAASIDRYGNPNVLFNNAGGALFLNGEASHSARGTLLLHDDSWDATVTLNLTSTYMMTQVCWRPMVEAGGGTIINMSSLAGVGGGALPRHTEFVPPSAPPAYFAAKAGIEAYTRWTATMGSRAKIRANCVRPGLIVTPAQPIGPDGKPVLDVWEQFQLTPGWGTAEDIANTVAFLASDESRFINAQMVNIDGGMAMKVS